MTFKITCLAIFIVMFVFTAILGKKELYSRSIAAGFILSLAGFASVYGSGSTPLLKAVIFPVGLIFIVFCNFALFTGAVGLAVPKKTTRSSIIDYTSTLSTIWFGNFIGAIVGAALLKINFGHSYGALFGQVFTEHCDKNPLALIILGIGCNFLICFGILITQRVDHVGYKAIVLFISVFLFIICGFEHSIANMGLLSFAVVSGFGDPLMMFTNLIPVTIGNIIGGLIAVPLVKTVESAH